MSAALAIDETPLAGLLREKKILVCCGAGGVGKTTTSAALALAAARMGRRVLVLTIDPSKRLAETLGVEQNPPAPVAIPAERAAAAGITAGSLETWMLDAKLVADTAVRRLVTDPAEAERVLQNRIYRQVTQMVAGMHEYTAMEALHRLVTSGRYDLVVLDTPPSRNALDFLDAPGRLAKLLDGRIFRLFLPKEGGVIERAASKVIDRVMRGVFGEEFAGELILFIRTFAGLFTSLGGDLNRMRAFLSQPDSGFVLVTAPSPSAVAEARFFREKARTLALPFRGFVLNRSRARIETRRFPDASILGEAPSPVALDGLRKLRRLAESERVQAEGDRQLLAALAADAAPDGFALAVPNLPTGADDLRTLLTVGESLLRA